ncbi:MAG: PKD domain-containing protein [Thaumarchaeota archaeon]|nr:PKD domain-containing protein [Nitrososphaerota archaeon]
MPSAPTRRQKKSRSRLAGAIVIVLIVVAALLFLLLQGGAGIIFPPTTPGRTSTAPQGPPINVQFTTPQQEWFDYIGNTPVALSLSAAPGRLSPAYVSYLWDFGDGTNSTLPAVIHVFPQNCIYDIRLTTRDAKGGTEVGTLLFAILPPPRSSNMLVVCPREGTAGITPVVLGGWSYTSSQAVRILSGGKMIETTTSDSRGSWDVNITGDLPPRVNGTRYVISTSPPGATQSFLTLEGIRASPTSGEPGDPFTLEGRSYPANTTVSLFLGGVALGQALTDENGTFVAGLQVPTALHYAGTYQFTTNPPVLGASASFRIPVTAATPLPPPFNLWWLVVLIVLALLVALIVIYWRRRKKRMESAGPQSEALESQA